MNEWEQYHWKKKESHVLRILWIGQSLNERVSPSPGGFGHVQQSTKVCW